jgi:cytoskeleton protein RodZ
MSDDQLESPQPAGDVGPGTQLSQARALRQLSIAEVAERLKYSAKQIEALEADDYSHLPGTTFVRGMIRGYSKLLGLDPAPVLEALDRRNIPAQATVDLRPQRIPFPDGSKRGTRMYVVLSALATAAILAVLYEWSLNDSGSAPTQMPPPQSAVVAPTASVSQPNTETAAPVSPAIPGTPVAPSRRTDSGRIQFEFQKESWVEVKDRRGNTLLSQLNLAGSRVAVDGTPPFSIIIGNAASVRLYYNDLPVDLKPYVKIEVARLTLD